MIAPSAAPHNISYSILHDKSVYVRWNIVSNAEGYVVVYQNSSYKNEQRVSTNYATIRSLSTNSTYNLTVYAYHHLLSEESKILLITFTEGTD